MNKRYQKLSEKLRSDLTGQRFGKLVVLSYSESRRRCAYWLCQCDCGEKPIVIAYSLTSGRTKSCGCYCRQEVGKRSRTHGKCNTREGFLWYKARRRAKRSNLAFNIQIEDIFIPEICPLLGIALINSKGVHSSNSPSLDRIESDKGYVKGNIWVISHRANTLKGNASLEELKDLVKNLEKHTKGSAKAAGADHA